jgi:hypothetical protein
MSKKSSELSRSSFSRTSFSAGRAGHGTHTSQDSELNAILLIDGKFAQEVFSAYSKATPDYIKIRRTLEAKFSNAAFVYSYYLDTTAPAQLKTFLKQNQVTESYRLTLYLIKFKFKVPDLQQKVEKFKCNHCQEMVERISHSEIDSEYDPILTSFSDSRMAD